MVMLRLLQLHFLLQCLEKHLFLNQEHINLNSNNIAYFDVKVYRNTWI